MAIHYLNSIDLNKNELQHAVIENQGSDALAGTGADGQLYFNTDDNVLKIWKNGGWSNIDSTVTYDLATADTGTAITLTGSDSTTDSITISGTSSEVEVTRQSGTELKIGLPDDVTISSQLVVGTTYGTQAPVIHAKSGGSGANLYLESFANSADDGPDLVMYRNTAPHAAGDYLGSLKFRGEESAGGYSVDYATMSVVMTNTESASVVFDAATPNTNRAALFAIHGDEDDGGKVIVNPASATTIPTHTLDVNGDANISSNLEVGGNLLVEGNLTVSGTTTYVDTLNVLISDNIITLNSDATGTPIEDAGIEVERGDETNVSLVWDESADRWTFTNDGSTFYNIPISSEYDNFNFSIGVLGNFQEVSDGGFVSFNQGGGLTVAISGDDSITYSHADTSDQASVNNSGRTYIQDVTLDEYGHVTGLVSATETVVDTNTQLSTAAALIDVSAMGSNKTASFLHDLGSKNLIVQLYDVTTGEVVFADIDHDDTDNISIIFASTPPNDIRVVVIDAKNGLADKTVTYS